MHLIMTYNHGERVLYLDGRPVDRLRVIDAGQTPVFDAELLIGAAAPHLGESGTYLDGDLDELFILGRVMSAQDIKDFCIADATKVGRP